jgi:hypothetical protein
VGLLPTNHSTPPYTELLEPVKNLVYNPKPSHIYIEQPHLTSHITGCIPEITIATTTTKPTNLVKAPAYNPKTTPYIHTTST